MVNNYEEVVYQEPRISLNKLGEYITTTKASRRERILKDAKYPPTFQVIRYDPTRNIIQRFLSGKIANKFQLAQEIADYELAPTKDDFDARMQKSNVEAMKLFKAHAENLGFEGLKVTLAANTAPRRMINGVSVSVRPELHLTAGGGNSPVRRGAIKLNISKGAVHSIAAAEYVGAILRHYIADTGIEDESDHQLCYSLDVFGQKLAASPKATTNRMKDVEAACGEIARQWNAI